MVRDATPAPLIWPTPGKSDDMWIAVVMPRGSRMCRAKANSMETVADVMNLHSRYRSTTTVFCDAGAVDPLASDLLVVPEGLGKAERAEILGGALEAYGPDLIEYHQQLGAAAVLARRFRHKINVLYRHTRIKPARNLFERWRYHRRLDAFDCLIFVSEAARAEFAADYPAFADRAVAIPNPVDIEAWSGEPSARDKLILFVGRAMEAKGLDAFCQALAAGLDHAPDWRGALMLGDWAEHAAWASRHLKGLERFGDRIEIHKSASPAAVRSVTRRAAIAVTPSRVSEALGLTALEAHAAGAALVSSGRGGLREASGEHAVYVDPPEGAALARALIGLMDDPVGRTTLARSGQSRVRALYSPARCAAQLDALRHELATRARN